MADGRKITDFTLLEALAAGDFIPIVRVGDTDNYRYDIHKLEQLILNKKFEIFDTIAQRDEYETGDQAFLCIVVDASADAEVDSGGALYAWKPGDPGEFKLLAKYGELDMAKLIAAAIDGATGKATLADADKIGIVDSEDGDTLKSHTWTNVKASLESIYAMWELVSEKVQLKTAKALNMQSKKIEGVADGVDDPDAVNKGQLEARTPDSFTYDKTTDLTTLNFKLLAGNVRKDNVITNIAAGTTALTDESINYVQVDMSGTPAVISNTTGFISGNIPLYEVTAAAGAITGYVDKRAWLSVPDLSGKMDNAIATTGVEIHFYTSEIYNSPGTPAKANITDDLTGAKIGIVQKIYHNHSTAPTFPAGWVRIGEGEYTTGVLNIIYAEWVSGTRVEYWITQEAV